MIRFVINTLKKRLPTNISKYSYKWNGLKKSLSERCTGIWSKPNGEEKVLFLKRPCPVLDWN